MFIFMRFSNPKRNHYVNLWPQVNQKGEIVFELREINSDADSLSYYFSGTDYHPSILDLEEDFGFYAIHFIVDLGK